MMRVQHRFCGRGRAQRRGLSLIEVMMSLTICAMLLTAVAAAFRASSAAVQENDEFFRASQSARVSTNIILGDLRRCAAAQVTTNQINVITPDGHHHSYTYDSANRRITVSADDDAGGPNTQRLLASGVTGVTFSADSEPDPKTQIVRVVRVSVAMTVEVGENRVRLSGSAAPRRAMIY